MSGNTILLHDLMVADFRIADPGDEGVIRVHKNLAVVPIVTVGADETRDLPAPTQVGLRLTMYMKTDGGDCVVTSDPDGVDQAGNLTMTFADAGDIITLESIQEGTTFVWRVVSFDGVAGVAIGATSTTTHADDEEEKFGDDNDFTMDWDGSNMKLLPKTDDTGALWVGNGSLDCDLKWWSDAGFVDFNHGTKVVEFDTIDIEMGDNDKVTFGDAAGGDVTMAWESADGEFHIDVKADDSVINIGDATFAADIKWFSGNSGDYVEFDADGVVVNFVDVDIALDDDAQITIGAGLDLQFSTDGTDGTIDSGSIINIGPTAATVKLSTSAGGTFIKSRLVQHQPTISTKIDTAAMSDAEMMSGIIEGTPTGAANYTTRSGTEIQTALEAIVGTIANGDSFELCIINLAAAGVGIITVLPGAGVTIKGSATIDDIGADVNSSGLFRFTRTASNVWNCHRIS